MLDRITVDDAVRALRPDFAVLLMTAAGLGDRFGRRRVFVAGIGLFLTASAACAVAPSVGAVPNS